MSTRRPRPRASRSTGPVAASALSVLLLTGALAGCGGDAERADGSAGAAGAEEPDAAAQACRDQWAALSDDVEEQAGPADGATPSTLRSRWVTVAAQVDYYAASATAADCEETLPAEEAQVAALTDFTASLEDLDLELALAGYERDLAETPYARPSGAPGRDAPTAARVEAALTDLARLAPQVTAQQAAGWQQAATVDLADAAARKQALADLRVVSGETAAYQQARRAVALLERARVAQADAD